MVVTHRRPRLATEVVRGLLEREGLAPERVILVVNGEGGLDEPGLEEAIGVLRLPDNPGPAGGFRAGMQAAVAAGAKWIYLCEDDVGLFGLPSPRLEALLAELGRLPADPSGRPVGAVVAYGRDLVARTGHTVVHHVDGPGGFDEVDAASWGASLVSRDVVVAGVLPVDDYFFGYEDFDFWFQLKAAGFRLLLDRTSAARVAGEMSLAGRDAALGTERPLDAEEPWRAFYVARNFFLLARRHGRPGWIAAHLAYSLRRLQLAASGRERRAIVAGLVAGVRGRSGKDPRFLRTVGERAVTPGRSSSRRPPLVLHVMPYDMARGGQVMARALADQLDGVWGQQRVLTLFEAPDTVLRADFRLNVPLGPLRAAGLDPRVLLRLHRALKLLQPAIVVAHGGEPLKYLAPLPARSWPLVYLALGIVSDEARSGGRHWLYRSLVGRSDLVGGVSTECLDEAHDLFGVPRDRLVLLPNGRDPGTYRPSAGSVEAGPVTVIFVGHLTRTKRPERFVQVVAAVRGRGHDVTGVMVGDGPMEADMRAIGPGAGVDVLGRRDDVPDLLRDADLLVFTSVPESEGMPGVLIEAGMAGLPVVATDVPGVSSIVVDGVTGLIVPVDDAGAMVAAVERLVSDRRLRDQMGAAARTHCVEQFSIAAISRRWIEVFERVTAG